MDELLDGANRHGDKAAPTARLPKNAEAEAIGGSGQAVFIIGQAEAPVTLTPPAMGETLRVESKPAMTYRLDFPLEGVRFAVEGDDIVVSFDTDGDGAADSHIVFLGLAGMAGTPDAPKLLVAGVDYDISTLVEAASTPEQAEGPAGPQLAGGPPVEAQAGPQGDAAPRSGGSSGYQDDFDGSQLGGGTDALSGVGGPLGAVAGGGIIHGTVITGLPRLANAGEGRPLSPSGGGDSGGDGGSIETVAGQVVDGYVAGATVFRDANENGVLDAGEVSATTDVNGNFTLAGGSGPLVAIGGTDISTGLPFDGVLKAPAGSTVITPLTTLVQQLVESNPTTTAAAAETQVKQALGLDAGFNLSKTDPVKAAATGDTAALDVVKAGIAVANTAKQVKAALKGGGATNEEAASTAAFKAIATQISTSGANTNLKDTDQVKAVITQAKSAHDTATGQATTVNDAAIENAAKVVTATNTAVDTAFNAGTDNTEKLTKLAQVAQVAQKNAANAIQQAVQSGDESDLGSYADGTAIGTEAGNAAVGPVTGVDVVDSNDPIRGDGGNNVLSGGAGNDVIYGEGGNDVLLGGAGNDLVYGGAGNDTLFGDAGNDTLYGDADNDDISGGAGNDLLYGGAGSDTLSGGAGADTLNGGDGTDTASYATSPTGVTVNLSTGTGSGGDAAGDRLSGIENLIGSAHADSLTGDDGANVLSGGAGNDTLRGGGGSDTLSGGAGNDILYGEAGNDSISGNAGDDVLYGGDGNDTLSGGAGADTLDGGAGIDTASYAASAAGVTVNLATGTGSGGDAEGDRLSGIENVIGSAHADSLTGDAGDNVLTGGGGNDTLSGGTGNDSIDGGDGDDTVDLNGQVGDYNFSFADNGTITVTNTTSGEVDSLTSVEILRFAGGTTMTIDGGTIDLTGLGGDASVIITGLGGINRIETAAGQSLELDATQIDPISEADGTLTVAGGAAVNVVNSGLDLPNDGDAPTVKNLLALEFEGQEAANSLIPGNLEVDGDHFKAFQAFWIPLDQKYVGADDFYNLEPNTSFAYLGNDYAAYLNAGGAPLLDLVKVTGERLQTLHDNLLGNLNDSPIRTRFTENPNGSRPDPRTDDGRVFGDRPYHEGAVTGGTYSNLQKVSATIAWDLAHGIDHDLNNLPAPYAVLNGSNTLTGTSVDDHFFGGGGGDTINGNDGDDYLVGGAGGDSLNGGAGNDTASYVGSGAGVAVNLATGTGTGDDADGDTLSSIENLIGSSHADSLTGDSAANVLTGGAGNDTLDGGAGNDTLDGGAGDDTLLGGDGTDTAVYAGSILDFTISATDDGSIIVADGSGDQGTDRLTGVEILQFADGTLRFDAALQHAVDENDGGGTDGFHAGTGLTDQHFVIQDNTEAKVEAAIKAFARYEGDIVPVGGQTYEVTLGFSSRDANGMPSKTSDVGFWNFNYSVVDYGDSADLSTKYDIKITADFQALGAGPSVRVLTYDPFVHDAEHGEAYYQDPSDQTSGTQNSQNVSWNSDSYDAAIPGIYTVALTVADKVTAETVAQTQMQVVVKADITVGNGAATIQEAVDDASKGDTIYVPAGTVGETVTVEVEELVVVGPASVSGVTFQLVDGKASEFELAGDAGFSVVGSGSGDLIIGNNGANLLQGGEGDDKLIGGGGSDTLQGGDGADSLAGGAGDDVLNGGDGIDVAGFETAFGNVSISDMTVTGGVFSGKIASDAEGTDTLSGIEVLKFDNIIHVLDGMSLQAAIDAAEDGDTIYIAPGTYSELTTYNGPGASGNLGLHIDKSVTIQGVDADGNPITDAADIQATVTSEAQSGWGTNFFVTADDVTIRGLKFLATGSSQQPYVNKAFEVIADNFTIEDSVLDATGDLVMSSAVYINDWAELGLPPTSAIAKYAVLDCELYGLVVSTNGVGLGRGGANDPLVMRIEDNTFLTRPGAAGDYNWGILVTGNDPQIAWRNASAELPTSVKGNDFTDADVVLLVRGDESQAFPTTSYVTQLLADNTVPAYAYAADDDGEIVKGTYGDSNIPSFSIRTSPADFNISEFGNATKLLVKSSDDTAAREFDLAAGTDGDDTLTGTNGSDALFGGDGDDSLDGGNLDDILIGGAGADTLVGGNGDDTLVGGRGADSLIGGNGADVFVYNDTLEAGDVIEGFNGAAGDRIDLDALFDSLGVAVDVAARGARVDIQQTGDSANITIDTNGNGDFDTVLATVTDINGTLSSDHLALVT